MCEFVLCVCVQGTERNEGCSVLFVFHCVIFFHWKDSCHQNYESYSQRPALRMKLVRPLNHTNIHTRTHTVHPQTAKWIKAQPEASEKHNLRVKGRTTSCYTLYRLFSGIRFIFIRKLKNISRGPVLFINIFRVHQFQGP